MCFLSILSILSAIFLLVKGKFQANDFILKHLYFQVILDGRDQKAMEDEEDDEEQEEVQKKVELVESRRWWGKRW